MNGLSIEEYIKKSNEEIELLFLKYTQIIRKKKLDEIFNEKEEE
jgi:hypothetical protein